MKINKDVKIMCLMFALSVTFMVSFHRILGMYGDVEKLDPFNKNHLIILGNNFSGWAISHFLLYTVLGFFFPQYFLFCMVAGIIWEMIEYLACYFNKSSSNFVRLSDADIFYKEWWNGNLMDIVFNFSGFIFGSGLYFQHMYLST